MTLFITEATWAYPVSVPLSNHNKANLEEGFRQGAEKLLLQLTSNESAAHSLTTNAEAVRSWVDAYSITPNPGNTDQPWQLDITYSNESIQGLLKTNHLPSWKKPQAPLDLVLKSKTDESLLDDDPRWQMLRNAAEARGYEFNLIIDPPQKLPADFLIAVVSNEQVNWSWYHNGQWQQWEQPLTNDRWASEATDTIGQALLKAQPQQSDRDLTPVHLAIRGIEDFHDYTQAIEVLRHLPDIRSMTDDGVHGTELSLTIITMRSVSDMKQALDRIPQLRKTSPANDSHIDLNYTWISSPPETADLQYQAAADTVLTVDEQGVGYDNTGHLS